MPGTQPTLPLKMRPAEAGDQQPVAEMIRARSAWMRGHGLPDWDAAADELAAQAGEPSIPMWVLTGASEVIGCTTLYEQSPAWLWTEQERAEPALFMATTVTHPRFAGQRLGCRLAWWVLDHAACTGRMTVRRGTVVPRLVRYYRDAQGWQVVRERERGGLTVVGLARRAVLMPDLRISVIQ
ncbi:hypothetical protein [Micromonospora sp. NPDC005324]|uniref:hypothetical protein n=1 Tax=Micromonospora sp. NPDC005324 TaxID=3157033 RepID=UPI0033BA8BF1